MKLDELQRSLAASLAAGLPSPQGCDPVALERARDGLEAKRRRAAGHLLPRLFVALGTDWTRRFHEHARVYQPKGLLHPVDDAWELAESIRRERDPRLASPAHDDLLALRLHWVRDRAADVARIRERRGPWIAILRVPPSLVIRLPGRRSRSFSLRLPAG